MLFVAIASLVYMRVTMRASGVVESGGKAGLKQLQRGNGRGSKGEKEDETSKRRSPRARSISTARNRGKK